MLLLLQMLLLGDLHAGMQRKFAVYKSSDLTIQYVLRSCDRLMDVQLAVRLIHGYVAAACLAVKIM